MPRLLTPADDGRTYAMTVGQTTTLRLRDTAAPEPEVEGDAVLLIAVTNVTASGAREWEVRAVEPGDATITGTDADVAWTIGIAVEG